MRALIRRLICLAYLALTCVPMSAALAVDAPDSSRQIGDLVKSAREQIGLVRNELDRIDSNLGSAGAASRSPTGAAGGFSAGRASYSELKRHVETLADIGNDVAQFASKCVDEAREVAGKFRSQTSRLRSSVSQLESTDSSMAQMTLSRMQNDLNAAEKQLQSVAAMGGSCGN